MFWWRGGLYLVAMIEAMVEMLVALCSSGEAVEVIQLGLFVMEERRRCN